MRETSREAWEYINQSGVVSLRRREAYNILYGYGPMTAQELQRKAEQPGLWKRISELVDMGLVEERGKRACGVTGRMAIIWDVTPNMPSGNKRSRQTDIRPASREELMRENESLKRELRKLTAEKVEWQMERGSL